MDDPMTDDKGWLAMRDEENARLREALTARHECLIGAQQTLEMVAVTLANAHSLDLAKAGLLMPVTERIELMKLAIQQTEDALSA